MDKLYLIYVNVVGKSYDGNYRYEFIFSDSKENIDGEDWNMYPASGRPEPPSDEFIKKVGYVNTEIKFDVVQDSDTFAVWDAIDGVIALAWENINDYEIYPDTRTCFRFGEEIEVVENKLYEKDVIIKYEKETK